MSTLQEITDKLIGLHKRRTGTHGKWYPTQYWIEKLKIDGLNNGRLRKALELCGKLMTQIEDSTHGHMHVEITQKRLPHPIGIKSFICCSTPKHPNEYVGNFNKDLFGKVLQAAWDAHRRGGDEANELATEPAPLQQQMPATQPTATPSPQQQPTTTVSPVAVSPQLNDEDIDLLGLFREIIRPEYLTKDDLFLVNAVGLRSKLVSSHSRRN